MNLFQRLILSPYLMLKDVYYNSKYAKEQIRAANIIIHKGIDDIQHEKSNFKEGRNIYYEIHADNNFIDAKKIHQNIFFAKILSIFIFVYFLIGLFYLDVFSIIFAFSAYSAIVVVALQYPLWMNHYRCIIPLSLYLRHAMKTKDMWLWVFNKKYYPKEKNGL